MREGLRILFAVALLAWGYSVIAIIQLPNTSSMDADPHLGRAR